MNLTDAFWDVINKLFKWRPIIMGCCDCQGTYYLTKNKIIGELQEDKDHFCPVISCPYCGLEHCVVFVRIDEGVKTITFETISEGNEE